MEKKEIKVNQVVEVFNLEIICGKELLDTEVEGGYASDMLSDVMANGKKGDIWITLQGHPNIVAVAKLKEIAAIVMVNNRKPEEETVKKAKAENIPIMTTTLPAFEIAGRLHEMGISGSRE